jgi:SNF2 family DNA or RNA helicase
VQQFPPPEKPKSKKANAAANDFIDDSGEDDEFRTSQKKHGPLALIHWYRVILDEAAQIRNKRTRAAQACFELDAVNRWVLSGTLIVNSLQDMYSYFHFLALSECADWDTFVRTPSCDTTLSRSHHFIALKARPYCQIGGQKAQSKSSLSPAVYGLYLCFHPSQTACNRIQAILKFGCMRRTKDTLIDGKPLLQLPEKTVTILEEDFDEDERGLYTASM